MATAVASHRGELCPRDFGSSASDDDDDAFADELESEMFEAEAIARRAERPGDESAKSTRLRGRPRGLASKAARPDDQSPGLATLPPSF